MFHVAMDRLQKRGMDARKIDKETLFLETIHGESESVALVWVNPF
jgi:hypothetical protein